MLIIIAIPATVWRHPSTDAEYTGFDANLMYSNPSTYGESQHVVEHDRVELSSNGLKEGVVDLATTTFEKFDLSLDATIADGRNATEPLRLGVWSPRAAAGCFLVFSNLPSEMTIETIVGGQVGRTLSGGTVNRIRALGAFAVGATYHIEIAVDKTKSIAFSIAGPGVTATEEIRANDLSPLFSSNRVAVTASNRSSGVQPTAALTAYSLALPHQVFWADKTSDARETFVLWLLIAIGAVLLCAGPGLKIIRARHTIPRVRVPAVSPRRVLIVASACIVYLAGNAVLFPLGGHPFDMGNEEVYAYVARAFGTAQLYYLPNVISLSAIWNGTPYIEAAFPYEPVLAYVSAFAGWANGLWPHDGVNAVPSDQLQYTVKTINVLFGLADGATIWLILRRLGMSQRRSLTTAAIFLFNPATWFSMSVWGQTHVISLFFVLLAVLLAETQVPVGAWLALAAACLTRPQMLVFGVLLSVVFFRKFSIRRNILALSWAVIVTFILLAPLTLSTSASLPVDVMRNVLHVQESGGNDDVLTTVSQDAYSIWPLVTFGVNGASGLARSFTPSSTILVGPFTYQRVSQVLTVLAILLVIGALAAQSRASIERGRYVPIIGIGVASFFMLLTGVVATHFLLALPFLILSRRWIGSGAYWLLISTWTIATFVPMYGDMGLVISAADHPILAASHNAVTRLAIHLYAWDRFITVSIVANLTALIWFGWLALRGSDPSNDNSPRRSIA
jgi:hypothetical protein